MKGGGKKKTRGKINGVNGVRGVIYVSFQRGKEAQQVLWGFSLTHCETVGKQSVHSTAGSTKQPYAQESVGVSALRGGKNNRR